MTKSKFSDLEPNMVYMHAKSNSVYNTDQYGRVTNFSADPRLTSKEERERNTEMQRTLGGKGEGFEHAGHLLSDRHGGAGVHYNLTPMQQDLDSRDYAAFEKETDALLQKGYAVHYNGELAYSCAENVEGVNHAEAIMVERQTLDPVTGEVMDTEHISFSNLNMAEAEYENMGNAESESLMAEYPNPGAIQYDENRDIIIVNADGSIADAEKIADTTAEVPTEIAVPTETVTETEYEGEHL